MSLTNLDKLSVHDDVLIPLTVEITDALIRFLNGNADTAELLKLRDKLRETRQEINNVENIGFYLVVHKWAFTTFSLTGDITKDGGQVNMTAPSPKKGN